MGYEETTQHEQNFIFTTCVIVGGVLGMFLSPTPWWAGLIGGAGIGFFAAIVIGYFWESSKQNRSR